MYWAGYLYRYWHILTKKSSKEIYAQAPAKTMDTNYLMFHTMAPELAITNYENGDRMPSTVQRLVLHSPEVFSRSMAAVIELYAPITRHFSYRVFKFPSMS